MPGRPGDSSTPRSPVGQSIEPRDVHLQSVGVAAPSRWRLSHRDRLPVDGSWHCALRGTRPRCRHRDRRRATRDTPCGRPSQDATASPLVPTSYTRRCEPPASGGFHAHLSSRKAFRHIVTLSVAVTRDRSHPVTRCCGQAMDAVGYHEASADAMAIKKPAVTRV